MRAVASLAATALLLLIGFAAAPAAVAGDPCYHGFDVPARSEEAATQIKVAPCAFAPTVAHVAVGGTVTFFNGPGFTHLITGANAEWGSRDVEVKPGQEVSYRFAKAGIYPYACALHRGMSGAIVVGNVATPAAAGPAAPAPAADANNAAATPSSENQATSSQGPAIGLIVGAGFAGIVIGGIGALGLIRTRARRDHAIA
jgi:plastocyanin